MATYDISGHPLLSATAGGLAAPALAAHGRIAEEVLGLAGSALAGDEAEAAKDAIVLQVNFQVDVLPDRDWGTLVEEDPFVWLKENAGVNPVALRMAGRLVGTGRKVPAVVVKPHVGTPHLATTSEQVARETLTTSKDRPFAIDIY